MAMNPRLLRPKAQNVIATALDASGNVIQPNNYEENGIRYRSHVFNGSGTFRLSRPALVECLIVGGGGGGGPSSYGCGAGGGGGGGLRLHVENAAAGSYDVVVGSGGNSNANGGNSSVFGITATGGGAGRQTTAGASGGSGGGGGGEGASSAGGAGTSGQGFAGGAAVGSAGTANRAGGGGGGAGGVGSNGTSTKGGNGGPGSTSTYADGTSITYAAGGGGGKPGFSGGSSSARGLGTSGVSGDGAYGTAAGSPGTANRGGGGGGASHDSALPSYAGGAGGTGIVVVRYMLSQESYDADAATYFQSVAIADGQQLEPAVKSAINDFIVGCKTDGIWSAIKASCILMGARTLSGALTPLVGTAPTNNGPFVSGDYNRKTGLVGNASTKHLNTNFSGTAVPRDDNHQSIYVSVLPSLNSAKSYIGQGNANDAEGPGNWHLTNAGTANAALTARNRMGGSVANSVSGAHLHTGFIGHRRNLQTGVDAHVVRSNGTNTGFTTGSTADDSRSNLVYSRGWPGATSLVSDARLAFYSLGNSLDLALLDSRVSTLYTAIGAAIP